MKLASLTICRNEDWVLALSLRALLSFCDCVVIGLHACIDGSAEIVKDLSGEYPGRLIPVVIDDPDWREMMQRDQILGVARKHGATHLWIGDCDEILSANLLPTIRATIEAMPAGRMLYLPGYNLRGGIDKYHSNGIWGNRWFATAFVDDPRLHWSGDQFHHREPMGMPLGPPWQPVRQGKGGIMHLWGASERRLVAKHKAYRVHHRLRWPDQPVAEIERQYSLAFDPKADTRFDQNWTYAPVPAEWWSGYEKWMHHLHVDAEPWQDRWVDGMIAKHGRERFAGLSV